MKNYSNNIKAFSLKIQSKNTDFVKTKITSSQDCYNYIKQFYFDDIEIFESFFLLLMNRANVTIGFVKISQGGTAGTVADIKIIAKYAVDSLASSVIIAHNHPSGETKPSEADLKLTKKCKAGLEMLDIVLHDHIILSADNFCSFADEGLF